MKKSLLSIGDLSKNNITELLELAVILKNDFKITGVNRPVLAGKTLTMFFEKPSLRTRQSFEIGMKQLGGQSIYVSPHEIELGKRESTSDVARVMGSYADMIMMRVFKHELLEEFRQHSNVPVINGLSDHEHPCQILADLLTIYELKGSLSDLTISFVGDCSNNVVHSLVLACAYLDIPLRLAYPKGYGLRKKTVKEFEEIALKAPLVQTNDPYLAVENVDVVITDTWISMGDEADEEERVKVFKPFQVNTNLMKLAKHDAIFMHCLPAHRGLEVTAEVIDGSQSVVFREAENRLHIQKAVLLWLMDQAY